MLRNSALLLYQYTHLVGVSVLSSLVYRYSLYSCISTDLFGVSVLTSLVHPHSPGWCISTHLVGASVLTSLMYQYSPGWCREWRVHSCGSETLNRRRFLSPRQTLCHTGSSMTSSRPSYTRCPWPVALNIKHQNLLLPWSIFWSTQTVNSNGPHFRRLTQTAAFLTCMSYEL